jgi:putative ABC transport system permease protein
MKNKRLLYLKLFRESFIFARTAIAVNKTRTALSLLGITIGIFCVISVLTIVDSIEIELNKSINSLGSNVLFIQKWPWAMGGGDYPWWKYWQRPEASLDELEYIQRNSTTVKDACFMVNVQRTVKYLNSSIDNCNYFSASHDYDKVMDFEISEGRYFTEMESNSGRNVAIIGAEIKKNLFPNTTPIGKRITLGGRKVEIIGVFKREGNDTFGNSHDEVVMTPVTFARNLIDLRRIGTSIMVRSHDNISLEEMKEELTGTMRAVRKLKPGADDNFAINETSVISQGFDSIFSIVSIVGWIMGAFSLLVGGFGIANIMFVSVSERTNQIGIQKSLGAKRSFILTQFLFEATILSILGGLVGLLLIYVATLIGTQAFNIEFTLTLQNILIALIVSGLIGIISGYIPARKASVMDPVEAIRTSL